MNLSSWLSLMALVAPSLGQADTAWTMVSSHLEYTVHHKLKTVTGVNDHARGRGTCTSNSCEFLVAAPVKDFNSGDGNRDEHMIHVTRALEFPMVVLRIKTSAPAPTKDFSADVSVEFAGEKRLLPQIPFKVTMQGDKQSVDGTIPLVLSEFRVERPSLLTMAVEDRVPVAFHSVWQKSP